MVYRGVAQLVARHVRDVEAASSNLVTPMSDDRKDSSPSGEESFLYLYDTSRVKLALGLPAVFRRSVTVQT